MRFSNTVKSITIQLTEQNFKLIPIKYIKGKLSTREKIYINISHLNLQKLNFVNNHSLEKNYGILNTLNAKNEYVPININYNNKIIKAKARIKGNWIDSRNNKKLSLRVKIKDNETVLNMKRFSLHAPEVKGMLSEWLFHKMLKYENLIHLKYDFIDLYINGESKGLMAIEEHFDEILIDRNHRKNGIILKIDESDWISSYMQLHEEDKKNYIFDWENNIYSTSIINSFSNLDPNDSLYKQFKIGVNLFEGFRSKTLAAEEVFDLKSFAKLFAIAELFGDSHSLESKNIKFYYNPITSLIEPIGYDNHHPIINLKKILPQNKEILNYSQEKLMYLGRNFDELIWPYQLLKNKKFYTLYLNQLNEISKPEWLDNFTKSLNEEWETTLNKIYSYNPSYEDQKTTIKKIRENQIFIKNTLNPHKLTNNFFQGFKNGVITFKIGNIYSMPIEIVGIMYKDYVFKIDKNNLHDFKQLNSKVNYKEYSFNFNKLTGNNKLKKLNFEEFKVIAKIYGNKNKIIEDVNIWPLEFIKNNNYSDLNNFNFFKIVDDKIYFNKKNIILKKNLIIPPHYKLIIEKGTSIDLINSSSIFSYSPIIAKGSKDFPINIFSSDYSGQGLTLVNAKTESIFEFTNFSQLSNYADRGLTGAINIYQSNVNFDNSVFENNISGDDFLNIIGSKFQIHNSFFKNVIKDAVDLDFSNGEILNTQFYNTGNDAIDGSGSNLVIEDCIINDIKDKGISAGERSKINLNNIKISKAKISIASKDGSEVNAKNIFLNNNIYGLTAYNKKEEFEYGTIFAENVKMENIKYPYIVDELSVIIVNEEEVKFNKIETYNFFKKLKNFNIKAAYNKDYYRFNF